MARHQHSWEELYGTPEGVLVEYCGCGGRRERELSRREAVELHVRSLANGKRGPREDPAKPKPPPDPSELRAELEQRFAKRGLK